ncbi:MAG TPA: energy transducer TonB [Terriglobales bacterium]|nr:energy transducer TonB [Terriglobales bacterium]
MKPVCLIILLISCVLQVSAEPLVKHKVGPSYPRLAWQAGIQGTVTVEIELDTDGNVVSAKASGAHEMLQRAAEENIRLWTFSEVTPDQHTLTFTYVYRIVSPEQGRYSTRLPVKFDLPHRRIEISVYPAEINP